MIDGQDRENLVDYLMTSKYGFPATGSITGFTVQMEDSKVKSLKSELINHKDHIRLKIDALSPSKVIEPKDENGDSPTKF